MGNKDAGKLLMLVSLVLLTQCRITREIAQPEAPVLSGVEGLTEVCRASDTIRSILISKAETVIEAGDERYEATVTLYAIKDSIIYFSAVNSGFEILRALVKPDTIAVIDRLNKVVYRSPVKKRFGYQHPVNFTDMEHLVSGYFLCDELERARELNFYHIVFNFDEGHIEKRISFNRETLKMEQFDFMHTSTNKYLRGEKTETGFRIDSNFIISEFGINAKGGTVTYNKELPVKMDVNSKRYSIVNL